MPRGFSNNPSGKNQHGTCGTFHVHLVTSTLSQLCMAVPASDERLKNALIECSRLGITSTKVIQQYLQRDLGFKMRQRYSTL
jgi:hypothetical protein